jgi:tRNA(Arg) A34 adenosine deaminase TadA
MCLGAIYWARPERFFYACTKKDAAAIGFDDQFIYEELDTPLEARKIPADQLMREEALKAFQEWEGMEGKVVY